MRTHSFPQKEVQAPEQKELLFGFVNFPKGDEAKNAFTEGKRDPEILALIDSSHNEKTEFIYYAQPAGMRKQFLRMVNKNYKVTQMMQNSFLMMTQNNMKFMKMQNQGGKNNNFRPNNNAVNQAGNRNNNKPFNKSGGRGPRENMNMNMNPMGSMPFMGGGMPQMNPMMMMGNNMANPLFQQMMMQQMNPM